jgi:mercuric ion binding protein
MISRSVFALILLLTALSPAVAGDRTVTLKIENMTCVACLYIVEQTLASNFGVKKAKVSFESKTATITFDDGQTDVSAITTATTNAGYPSQLLSGD